MPVRLDVEAQLDETTALAVAEGIKRAVREALNEILFLLTLTDDEKAAVADYRQQRAADRAGAHATIKQHLGIDRG